MPFGFQPMHLIVIAVVALVIFGPKQLPEIGRGLGKMYSEFRTASRDITETFSNEMRQPGPAQSPLESASQPGSPPLLTPVDRPQPSPIGMVCDQCGASNPAGSHFCSQCGQQLPAPQSERTSGMEILPALPGPQSS